MALFIPFLLLTALIHFPARASQDVEGLLELGKRVRNLQLICPGTTDDVSESPVPQMIQARLKVIAVASQRQLTSLLPTKIYEEVMLKSMPSQWKQKSWAFAPSWLGYLNSLDFNRRQLVLETLYVHSLARLSTTRGKAQPTVFFNETWQQAVRQDRPQATWMLKALNPAFVDTRHLKDVDSPLPRQRSLGELFEEMGERITFLQNDPRRPPFGHAMASCGMACNSHFADKFGKGEVCHKIYPEKDLTSQLDSIENGAEAYSIPQLLRQRAKARSTRD